MSLFFIYFLSVYLFIYLFIYLLVPRILRQDNHISRGILLLLLKVFLLANFQFLESNCTLEFDIMYTHEFLVLRTVTLPVHMIACWQATQACCECIIIVFHWANLNAPVTILVGPTRRPL